jgi:hypothetical protein
LWPDLNFAVAGFDNVSLEAKVPRTREHFRQGGSYGHIRRARQKQKHSAEAAEMAGMVIKKGHPIVRVSVYDSVETANKIIELPAGSSPKS